MEWPMPLVSWDIINARASLGAGGPTLLEAGLPRDRLHVRGLLDEHGRLLALRVGRDGESCRNIGFRCYPGLVNLDSRVS
eukprot:2828679-Pyramimonas_sp.AAC.1